MKKTIFPLAIHTLSAWTRSSSRLSTALVTITTNSKPTPPSHAFVIVESSVEALRKKEASSTGSARLRTLPSPVPSFQQTSPTPTTRVILLTQRGISMPSQTALPAMAPTDYSPARGGVSSTPPTLNLTPTPLYAAPSKPLIGRKFWQSYMCDPHGHRPHPRVSRLQRRSRHIPGHHPQSKL